MHVPPSPPWLRDMPGIDHPAKAFEGLPSHAASEWKSGRPHFTVDQRRARILAVRGRCWQCGYPVNGPGFAIVTEDDAKYYRDSFMPAILGPLHRSCALYACAGACPYLRYPTSRRRLRGPGLRKTASIHGFARCAILWLPGPMPSIDVMCFAHFSPTEIIPIASPARIAELYEQAVTTDAATNFTATPRLTWTDSPDDMQRLNTDWAEARQVIFEAKASTVTIGGRDYPGQSIDECAVLSES
ncbi:MAG: hypothetical protein VX424_22415 [Actinomycetota bacterium]|nr:hypothetical protein [Actinomycetota bacterium]